MQAECGNVNYAYRLALFLQFLLNEISINALYYALCI